jgi:hypothetical protein
VAESSQKTRPLVEDKFESPYVMVVHLDWHTPFMMYLMTEGLLDDKDEREQLWRWAGHYTLVNNELFW